MTRTLHAIVLAALATLPATAQGPRDVEGPRDRDSSVKTDRRNPGEKIGAYCVGRSGTGRTHESAGWRSAVDYDFFAHTSLGFTFDLTGSEFQGSFSPPKLPTSPTLGVGVGGVVTIGSDGSVSIGVGAGVPLVTGVTVETGIYPLDRVGTVGMSAHFLAVGVKTEVSLRELSAAQNREIADSLEKAGLGTDRDRVRALLRGVGGPLTAFEF